MRRMGKMSTLALSAIGLTLSVSGPAAARPKPVQAAAVTYGKVPGGIAQKLERWSVLVKDPKTSPRLADEMYWPQAEITGEGAKRTYKGLDEIRAYFAQMGAMAMDLHFKVLEPSVTSGRLSSTLSEMVVKGPPGKPDMVASALMVWERRGAEWKIVREVYLYAPLQ